MGKARSEVKTWSISLLAELVAQRKVELPHFQRSVVWSEDQKTSLIDSLLRGYPVGALLLWHKDDGNYQLVDGLQRTTAIRDYLAEPLTLLPQDTILDAHCSALAITVSGFTAEPVSQEAMKIFLSEWVREVKTFDRESGFDSITLIKRFSEQFELERPMFTDDGAITAVQSFLSSIQQSADISKLDIPAMIFYGDESSLPDIFELLNTQGTELGKYDIFAATWVKQEMATVDQEIKDKVREKYRYLIEDKGYSIDGVGADLTVETYTLSEYLFGLGKVLSSRDEYQTLFEPSSDSSDPDSVSFTLMTIAHKSRLGDMKSLPQQIRRLSGGDRDAPIDLSAAQAALMEACSFTEEVLRPYIGLKLNSQKGKPLVAHTEYQICSLIGSVLAHMYEPGSWKRRDDWATKKTVFEKTIPQHYLYDVLQRVWQGAGDTRLYNRVWMRPVDSDRVEPSGYYLNSIAREDWERQLDSWNSQQLQKVQTTRQHVDKAQKVFLMFLYSNTVTHHQLHSNQFEIEHVIPVSTISSAITDGEGWPISAIGNLALLTKPLNREKSSQSIAQYVMSFSDPAEQDRKREELKTLLFADIDNAELKIGESVEESRAFYKEWTTENFEQMKRELLDKVLPLD